LRFLRFLKPEKVHTPDFQQSIFAYESCYPKKHADLIPYDSGLSVMETLYKPRFRN